MSKIVDRKIMIPVDVKVTYQEDSRTLSINGSNGKFSLFIHPFVEVVINSDNISTISSGRTDERSAKAFVGTINSLIFNAVKGSKDDYKKVLEVRGVGYKALVQGKNLIISVGYSHDINVSIPEDVKVECLNNNKIIVSGCDKQKVGWFASKIRDYRRPNVFVKSLKGIFYETEVSTFKVKVGKRDSKK